MGDSGDTSSMLSRLMSSVRPFETWLDTTPTGGFDGAWTCMNLSNNEMRSERHTHLGLPYSSTR